MSSWGKESFAIVAVVIAILALALASQPPTRLFFKSSTFDCDLSTTNTVMLGFGASMQYTPTQSGKASVTLNFIIHHPAGDHDVNYTLAYGTGTAPSCGAAPTGTTVGNTYVSSSLKQSGPGSDAFFSPSDTVVLNMTKGTTYWFDLQVHIETTDTHNLYNPQITVTEP